MGIKPLYFNLTNQAFSFASNTQALSVIGADTRINSIALQESSPPESSTPIGTSAASILLSTALISNSCVFSKFSYKSFLFQNFQENEKRV
jgi:asparagine synthetase B (glutamine-hydrolysing)